MLAGLVLAVPAALASLQGVSGTLIISHQYRFIFLRTRKTAGTSIDIALSRFAGPVDVVTPVGPAPHDERLRARLGFRQAQHYHKRAVDSRLADLTESLRIAGKKLYKGSTRSLRPMAFHNHMTAADVRSRLPADVWNSYFKFAVERNPWDFAVSLYFWKLRRKRNMSFGEFVRRGYPERYAGHHIYCIDGEPAVDRLITYERLAEGLDEVSARLGLPESIRDVMESIQAKQGYRETEGYRGYYDRTSQRVIDRSFATVIAELGYQF